MKLLIAIPALNEEASIAQIIERSLAARAHIIETTFVDEVDITVVSDGSTDGTVEIAKRYEDKINLIVFSKNRGYGAAIKEAWRQSDAELLSFLDADGTCDPRFFSGLCKVIEMESADVVLGCRLNPKSKMPLVRRIGNTIYAVLLTLFSSTKVRDSASGMRVVRRASLQKIMPLPDGLHFTPAMSARSILSEEVKIVEIDMPYEERAGESKLSLWKDGLRFLRVIFESAILYNPSKLLDLCGFVALTYAAYLMMMPILFYVQNHRLEEWMIYRFVVSNLAGIAACLLFCAGHLSRKIVEVTLTSRPWSHRKRGFFGSFFRGKFFWLVIVCLLVTGGSLVVPSFLELIKTGATYEHWSRFIAMSFLYAVTIIFLVTRALVYSLDMIAARISFIKSKQYERIWFKEPREIES